MICKKILIITLAIFSLFSIVYAGDSAREEFESCWNETQNRISLCRVDAQYSCNVNGCTEYLECNKSSFFKNNPCERSYFKFIYDGAYYCDTENVDNHHSNIEVVLNRACDKSGNYTNHTQKKSESSNTLGWVVAGLVALCAINDDCRNGNSTQDKKIINELKKDILPLTGVWNADIADTDVELALWPQFKDKLFMITGVMYAPKYDCFMKAALYDNGEGKYLVFDSSLKMSGSFKSCAKYKPVNFTGMGTFDIDKVKDVLNVLFFNLDFLKVKLGKFGVKNSQFKRAKGSKKMRSFIASFQPDSNGLSAPKDFILKGNELAANSACKAGDKESCVTLMRSGKKSSSMMTNQYSKNAVKISAIPLAPVVEGKWIDVDKKWIALSETAIRKQFGKSVAIKSVRTKKIAFYSTEKRQVFLVEAVPKDRVGAYYLIAVAGQKLKVVLDNSDPIHKLNKLLDFTVDNVKEAVSYLKYFTSSISSKGKIFLVLNPDVSYLSKKTMKKIGVNPIQVSGNKKKGWSVFAYVLYGDDVFKTKFLVHKNGSVEMISDSFVQKLSLNDQVVVNDGLRLYLK